MSLRVRWQRAGRTSCAILVLVGGVGLAGSLDESTPPHIALSCVVTPDQGFPREVFEFDATGNGTSGSQSLVEARWVGGGRDTVQVRSEVLPPGWTSEFADAGLDDAVASVGLWGGQLMAGRRFIRATSGTVLNYVGMWDGSA